MAEFRTANGEMRPRARLMAFCKRACWLVLLGLIASPGNAQIPSNDQLQQLQQQFQQSQQRQGSSGSSTDFGTQQPNVVLQPAVPVQTQPQPPSRIEQIMSLRANTRLKQFGYDQLGQGRAVSVPQTGAVQDSYVLGPGDEVVVSMRGQENGEFRATVDRNGRVVLPRLPPLPASGRDFGSFRADLEAAVHRAYVATEASVAIGRMRLISVLVSGEVNQPGQRQVTGLSTALDAILLAGGVRKTGSLRNIRVERAGRVYNVDLYGVLSDTSSGESFALADGDRILVPILGQTVAVAGLVRRPGIYELRKGTPGLSVAALMRLAGGAEVRGQLRTSLMRILPDGRSAIVAVTPNEMVRDSEILSVELGADQTSSQATLSGGTGLAGNYAIANGTKLSQVLKAPGALGRTPYTPFGLIVRKDPVTLLPRLMPFTPSAVLAGTEDMSLQSDDVIRVFSINEEQLLAFAVQTYTEGLANQQNIIRNPLQQTTGDTTARTILSQSGQNAEIFDIGSVPASVQRRQVNAILNVPMPGSLLALQVAAEDRADRRAALANSPNGLAARQNDGTNNAGGQSQNQPQLQNQTQYPQQAGAGAAAAAGAGVTSIPPNGFDPNGIQSGNFNAPAYAPNPQLSASDRLLLGLPDRDPNQPDQGIITNDLRAPNFLDQSWNPNAIATNREVQTFGQLARQLNMDPLVLINFLVDSRVRLDGAVRGPGYYFAGPNASLNDVVMAAGGTINWVNESGVELISAAVDRQSGQSRTMRTSLPLNQDTLAKYIVRPRDQFRFSQTYTDMNVGSVTVQGEVRSPGTFPILRGEHLSELLARAGGLTNVAYPNGTVFLRQSAAQRERESFQRAASEVQDQLIVAMSRIGNDKVDPAVFVSMQSFVTELRNQRALGRISIVADPSQLAANPAMDPLLESGDVVYIPQRPSTVSVLGQVLQPGSFPYRPNESVKDYIARAGGYSATADSGNTFVVLPDGSARRVETSWLSFSNVGSLPPGSSIVIPRDVTPLDLRQTIIDVSQIFSQFAVAIASVAVLSKQ